MTKPKCGEGYGHRCGRSRCHQQEFTGVKRPRDHVPSFLPVSSPVEPVTAVWLITLRARHLPLPPNGSLITCAPDSTQPILVPGGREGLCICVAVSLSYSIFRPADKTGSTVCECSDVPDAHWSARSSLRVRGTRRAGNECGRVLMLIHCQPSQPGAAPLQLDVLRGWGFTLSQFVGGDGGV